MTLNDEYILQQLQGKYYMVHFEDGSSTSPKKN